MRMLFVGTHGSESPTHAVLPFLSAQGALEEGHEAEVALMGDAVVLMKDVVATATVPVGWPPVGEVLAGLIARQVPLHVWGGCAAARGVAESDLQGKHATLITPRVYAQRVAAADRVVTY